jgi:hypothetical protein
MKIIKSLIKKEQKIFAEEFQKFHQSKKRTQKMKCDIGWLFNENYYRTLRLTLDSWHRKIFL